MGGEKIGPASNIRARGVSPVIPKRDSERELETSDACARAGTTHVGSEARTGGPTPLAELLEPIRRQLIGARAGLAEQPGPVSAPRIRSSHQEREHHTRPEHAHHFITPPGWNGAAS